MISTESRHRNRCDRLPFRRTDAEHIPAELRERQQWVGWQFVSRPGRARPAKLPISPHSGRPAKPDDPATWAPFPDALALWERQHLNGIGYVFAEDDPFAGVDLDHCRDPATGRLDFWAEEIVTDLGSYTEISPSGTGVKVVLRAKLPGPRCRRGRIELYDRGRYFALTGLRLDGSPNDVVPGQVALDALYRELFDREVRQPERIPTAPVTGGDVELLRRAASAKNGAKFVRLWAGDWSGYLTHSEADLALCGILAFWTGGDRGRIDSLFRQSGLSRDKWDEARGGETYGQRTVRRAVEGCRAYYGAADLSMPTRGNPNPFAKTQNRVHKSVPPHTLPNVDHSEGEIGHLVEHIGRLRHVTGRPVGLSSRQAGTLLSVSYRTAARRLKCAVTAGHLIRVFTGTNETRLASEYDLPKRRLPDVKSPTPRPRPSPIPTAPPPYTRSPGGAFAVWRWCGRRGQWQDFGCCPDQEAADAVAGRHMSRWPGWWSVGGVMKHYARGRRLRVMQGGKSG